jgi:hypothetical protein
MDELLTQRAQTYARRFNIRLAERLGHGIHGIVYAAERNTEPGNSFFAPMTNCWLLK